MIDGRGTSKYENKDYIRTPLICRERGNDRYRVPFFTAWCCSCQNHCLALEPGILPVFGIIWVLEWATVQNSTLSLNRPLYYSEG